MVLADVAQGRAEAVEFLDLLHGEFAPLGVLALGHGAEAEDDGGVGGPGEDGLEVEPAAARHARVALGKGELDGEVPQLLERQRGRPAARRQVLRRRPPRRQDAGGVVAHRLREHEAHAHVDDEEDDGGGAVLAEAAEVDEGAQADAGGPGGGLVDDGVDQVGLARREARGAAELGGGHQRALEIVAVLFDVEGQLLVRDPPQQREEDVPDHERHESGERQGPEDDAAGRAGLVEPVHQEDEREEGERLQEDLGQAREDGLAFPGPSDLIELCSQTRIVGHGSLLAAAAGRPLHRRRRPGCV